MEPSVPDHFERMWADLAPVGRSSSVRRLLPPAVHHPRARARRRGSSSRPRPGRCASSPTPSATSSRGGTPTSPTIWSGTRRIAADPSGTIRPGVVTGSHLDSVLDGGAYDGPLGVVSALAAVDLLRERGFRPARPIGVSVFVEEEGSRFGLACLGSRLATGATDWSQARALRDRDGVPLEEAMASAGLDVENPQPWLDSSRIECFVELHVEQGRDLVDRGRAVGVASRIWPHGRYRFDITGEPNHAGHDADGGPQGPDADLRDDRARRQQAGAGGRAAGDLRPRRDDAQLDQLGALGGHRLAGRAVRERGGPGRPRRHDHAAGRGARRAGRDVAHGHRRVGVGRGRLRPGPRGADRRRPRGRRLAGHPDAGRPRRRNPVSARDPERDALRPQPDRRLALARPSTPRSRTAWPGSTRSPRRSSGSRDERPLVVPPRAGVGRRRRPRRRAGRDRGRTLHFRHIGDGFPRFGRCNPDERGIPVDRRSRRPHPPPRAHDPGAGELPQPRLPPGAARADPARAGDVLDLARADVRRRRAARPRLLPRPGRRVTFREMVAAGITCVGEFHYLHHQPDGTPYDDPNAMGHALLEAARDGRDPDHAARHLLPHGRDRAAGRGRAAAVQRRRRRRLGERVDALAPTDGARIGAAFHSVRAVPRDQMRATDARRRCTSTSPSRSRRTSSAWRRTASPRPRSSPRPATSTDRNTLVHATHLTDDDVGSSARRRRTSTSAPPPSATSATASAPAAPSHDAGARLTLGSATATP